MYCKNCGEKLNEGVNFCFNCGFKSGEGQGYCDKCGVKLNSSTCSNCGNIIEDYRENLNREGYNNQNYYTNNNQGYSNNYNNQNYNSNYVERKPKSKVAAGILGILVGGLGIHRFYLGYVGIGILQIVVTILTCGAGSLWGFIEGILILCGTTIEYELEKGNLAGASIYVIKDGKEIFSKQFGYSNLEEKIEMKRDTIFSIYSMSKPITAAATMLLIERELLSLDTPVSKFLNGFKNQKVLCNGKIEDSNREVVIKDLLTMTSGVAYPSDSEVGQKVNAIVNEVIEKELMRTPLTTVEFANKLGQIPLEFQPGEKWAYGFSADILGAVIRDG